jgi:hypothetical protein
MAVPRRIALSAIEVVGVRLLMLEPLEGSVAVNDITRTTRGCQYKRFSRCSLRRSQRALYCYFEAYCSTPSDSSRYSLRGSFQIKADGGGITRRSQKKDHRHGTDNIHYIHSEAQSTFIGHKISLTDGYTQTTYVADGRHAKQAIS